MNFFENKNEKPLSQDPIDYLNKDKNTLFDFFTSSWGDNKNKLSESNNNSHGFKITMIALPVLAICIGTGLGVLANYLNQTPNQIINVNQNLIKRKIYLISEDNFTIPVTVTLDKKDNVYEEILDVINLLKVSTNASNDYLRGYIPDETRVNSFEIIDNVLNVDFSEEFLQYKENNEHLYFNSLIASLSEFDTVEKVNILVEGQNINEILTSSYKVEGDVKRLNNIFSSPSIMENKELVTVFYNREYDDNVNYLIPVSLYANKGESDNITYVNALFKKLPSLYQLSNVDIYNFIDKNQSVRDDFSLSVTTKALVDEETVNKNLYEIVKLSLHLMNRDEIVSFNIEGESLKVDGIYDEEDQKVSSIYYNEIEI